MLKTIAALLLATSAGAAPGPLINGNQINPQTAISISTLGVTGAQGLSVARQATVLGSATVAGAGGVSVTYGVAAATVATTGTITISGAAGKFFQSSSQSSFGPADQIISGGSGVDTALTSYAAGKLHLGTGASAIITADSSGNVGIQTQSPATTLDVNGSAQFGSGATKSTFTATGALTMATGSTITTTGSSTYLAPLSLNNTNTSGATNTGVDIALSVQNTVYTVPGRIRFREELGQPDSAAGEIAFSGSLSGVEYETAKVRYSGFEFGVASGTSTVTGAFVIGTSETPASSAACTAGKIVWDASYIYVCTASGAWKRAALTGGY